MRTFTPHAWRLALLTLLLTFGASHAQEQHLNPYALITSAEQVAEIINQAQAEILLASPNLRNRVIAEALHKAMLERGVALFILTSVTGANEDASYFHALHLAGAHTRIYDIPEPALIIDRTYYVAGGLLKPAPRIGEQMEPSQMISDQSLVQQISNSFVQLYAEAFSFNYTLDRDSQ